MFNWLKRPPAFKSSDKLRCIFEIDEPILSIPETDTVEQTKDRATQALDILNNPLFLEIENMLVKQRLKFALDNIQGNDQFLLVMSSVLGIKSLREKLAQFAEYVPVENEPEEFKHKAI